VAAQIAAVGRFVADGRGNVTGHDVVSVNGASSPRTLTGTYSVNRDCTGTAEVDFVPARHASFFLVIVDRGGRVRMIQTTPGIQARSRRLPNARTPSTVAREGCQNHVHSCRGS
jgi:hypothetical protein